VGLHPSTEAQGQRRLRTSRYNGARFAQRNGLRNADFQVKMAAMAYNLKHWLVLTLERKKQQRVQSNSS